MGIDSFPKTPKTDSGNTGSHMGDSPEGPELEEEGGREISRREFLHYYGLPGILLAILSVLAAQGIPGAVQLLENLVGPLIDRIESGYKRQELADTIGDYNMLAQNLLKAVSSNPRVSWTNFVISCYDDVHRSVAEAGFGIGTQAVNNDPNVVLLHDPNRPNAWVTAHRDSDRDMVNIYNFFNGDGWFFDDEDRVDRTEDVDVGWGVSVAPESEKMREFVNEAVDLMTDEQQSSFEELVGSYRLSQARCLLNGSIGDYGFEQTIHLYYDIPDGEFEHIRFRFEDGQLVELKIGDSTYTDVEELAGLTQTLIQLVGLPAWMFGVDDDLNDDD